MNLSFSQHQLERAIKVQGREYTFIRRKLNEFNEPVGDPEEFVVRGLYHESEGYVTSSTGDGGRVTSKPQSWILTLVKESNTPSKGMEVGIDGVKYKVRDLRNVGKLGMVYDISLEEVLT